MSLLIYFTSYGVSGQLSVCTHKPSDGPTIATILHALYICSWDDSTFSRSKTTSISPCHKSDVQLMHAYVHPTITTPLCLKRIEGDISSTVPAVADNASWGTRHVQTACIKLGRSWHDSLTGTASLRSMLYCVGVLLKDVDAASRYIKKSSA